MKKKFRFQWGAFLMFLVYGGLFFLLFGRMLFIQITGQAEGKVMASLAEMKYARESTLQADRGSIIDRNGELIASDTLSYKLIAVVREDASKDSKELRHVVDIQKTADVLSQYLPMEKEEIKRILEEGKAKEKYQVEFGKAGRDISHETVLAIREAKLPGLIFPEDKKRFYPNGDFASYLIGFATREKDKDEQLRTIGKMGLEATYNDLLNGSDGKVNFNADKWGIILPKTEKVMTPAKDGFDIQLTLDKTIQNFVEDALNRVEKEYAPKKMMVVVADPKTGQILAMSQRPSFHPGTREGLTENWLNEAVEETIEPGSTMKMFTLASAIEEKKWDGGAYYQSGQYTIYDKTIRDVNQKGWGTITFLEGFQRSSNVSMAYLLERMGDKTFIDYIHRFGFGSKVGIELPHEASGIVLDNFPSERLTTSYGQGSTVTPIQMIQAATAIANDGEMMKPYVIDNITDPNTGKVIEKHEPQTNGTPISKETSALVREILASTVTSDIGTARPFALNGYTVGGKTGTAQIPNPNGPGYMTGNGNYLYSFLGMAPADDPQLLTYVYVQQPKLKNGEYGSKPVSDIFTSVMESSLKYMNIVPDDDGFADPIQIDSYIGKSSDSAAEELTRLELSPVIIGEGGKIERQFPNKGTELGKGASVLLKTTGDSTMLPDFTGWSKKMILSFKMLSGLDIRINGDGYAIEQSATKGTVITSQEPIVIQLQPPFEQYKPKAEETDEETIMGG